MERGFFSSLFDISFTNFITTKIIKFVYVVTLIIVGLAALFFIVGAFKANAALGLLVLLVVAPLMSLIYVIYARIVLELIVQIFRITELLRDQNHLQRAAFAAAGWLPGSAPPASQIMSPAPPPPEPPATTATEVTAEPTTPAECPQCGAAPTPGAAFCRNCGHRFA